VGHWNLSGDAKDSSAAGNDALVHSVKFSSDGGAALFDGRTAYLEIPSKNPLTLEKGEFSISVWVNTEEVLDDALGDIANKYDSGTRTGFNLGILNNAGVGSGQSNYRNLFFGIDSGKIDKEWSDCGRPGSSLYIKALTVFDGDLYAGTYEGGKDERGHIYRYAGGTDWVECGSPDPANAISALAVFDGELYAGASHYRAGGSALEASENTTPGGNIYRYKGGTDWELCGKLEGHEAILGLVVYKEKLYASSLYHPPGLYRYDGEMTWTDCGNPDSRCVVLGVWNGMLLSGGYDGNIDKGGIARYDGGKDWTYLGTPPGVTQTYSFAPHFGDLYVGTWPEGTVFRYGGGTDWHRAGRLGEEKEVMGMMVYNGKLYAGTLPLARVYRFDGGREWTNTGQLDKTPDVKYRRVWTMAIHDGKLFAGTLPSGHVYSLEAGKCVTYDREVPPGWRHIAAVREKDRLKLYLDGKLVATSDPFDPEEFDLTNDRPLQIGFGPQDYFKGSIRDFRLFDRALSQEETRELYESMDLQ
jgi:hypothetical protein